MNNIELQVLAGNEELYIWTGDSNDSAYIARRLGIEPSQYTHLYSSHQLDADSIVILVDEIYEGFPPILPKIEELGIRVIRPEITLPGLGNTINNNLIHTLGDIT